MASQLKVSDVELMTIGYRNRTILVFSICFPLAVLSVSLRFLSRVLAKNPFWWDDWFALIGLFLVSALQCVPVQANWDPIAKQQPGVKCVDLNGFFFGTSIPNIMADLFLVVLPIPQVIKLKITTAQKVFVILFFILGGFVVITSIVRLELITTVNFATFTVNFSHVNAVVWTMVENCCGVISVCLPSLRPIIRFIPWKAFQNAFIRSSQDSKSQSKQSARMDANIFGRSRQRSQWSQIESTNEGRSVAQPGITKQTEIEVNSIEMGSLSNSSQVRLAGAADDSKP
ncbi:hypothetical protein FPRO05_13124 [Fusarium proliferatum]|uniref:Rhodopsin domain-containing protein n=1 Tax=Gibberella intermedia TaxID=948311 RepID=A0A365N2T0_GIBIN|nr:hypothetical protein FPRO05_13124 [Fusarium proliferatum]